MGLAQDFWHDMGECLDDILKPAGMTYDDFKNVGLLKGKWEYKSYEKKGFNTASGKIEIHSQQLKEWGYDPLPNYQELPESFYSTPELFKEYPLIFTSAKDPFYFHSSSRKISSLRRLSPNPIVLIHPETASQVGIGEGIGFLSRRNVERYGRWQN